MIRRAPTLVAVVGLLFAAVDQSILAQTTLFNGVEVPGVVIAHSPASTGHYLASPSIVIMPNGDYVASHNVSGTGNPYTRVYRSTDRGQSWNQISTITFQTWANLFLHDHDLYILGTSKSLGNLVIRRSTDGGVTWTTPTSAATGLLKTLTSSYAYHTAPVPVVVADGRIWRAYEDNGGSGEWAYYHRIAVMSAPVDSDLLNAANWTHTNLLTSNTAWLPSNGFQGWLEGNAVVDREGKVVNVLRVDVGRGKPEVAAIARVQDTSTLTFDAAHDIVPMPGGAKKFTIRYHEGSDAYWTLASIVNDDNYIARDYPRWIRNTLALLRSDDLRNWTVERIVLQDLTDVDHIGFHYVDWQFDGNDIVAVSRTAYPDGLGGAHNYHDANFFTFHRVVGVVPEPGVAAWLVIFSLLGMIRRNRESWRSYGPGGRCVCQPEPSSALSHHSEIKT
ncbi:MAG: exo-alpha-sialidase [Phycisphaeraceae bacterium]|nr:exo-alpha-sialidase [Phycisphaeraceae bacterium]